VRVSWLHRVKHLAVTTVQASAVIGSLAGMPQVSFVGQNKRMDRLQQAPDRRFWPEGRGRQSMFRTELGTQSLSGRLRASIVAGFC
jgi:hypothetical protein